MATALNPRPGPALLPTSVIGSHALPSWVWTAMEAIRAGTYGPTDVRETLDDAVNAAFIRNFSKAVRGTLSYGYFVHRDETTGGRDNYDAHLVFSTITYRF